MKFYQIALNFIFTLTLFACSQEKGAQKEYPHAQEKGRPGVCYSEKFLMAPNIVGGSIVNKGDPEDKSVVLLYMIDSGSICTAAPIAKDVLLTAAHCVGDDPGKLAAVFYPSLSCESGFNFTKYATRVSKIARHTGYNLDIPVSERKDDIALVFLKSNIPEGYPVYKIADPNRVNDTNEMYLFGYGVIGEHRGGAGILRKTTVSPGRIKILDADKKVRVEQADASGFCMGDSGGPGMVKLENEKHELELQILGVNSYVQGRDGDICNKLGYQTLVNSYKEWIDFQMN